MAPKVEFIEPCDFQLLRLAVTDDASEITRRFDKMVADNRAMENSTNPQHRVAFRRIFDAGTNLKDPAKRQAIIDGHADGFAEFVTQFCAALNGPITKENYQFLVDQGQARAFHLSSSLATAIVDRTVARSGSRVDGHNAAPPGPPTLVTQMIVDMAEGCPRVRWQRPPQGCDRIVVRAGHDGFPSSETDGREVFNGSADECLDDKALPGKTWYYSAFSFSGNRCSSEAAKASYFFAVGVLGLQATGGLQQISLSWQPPTVDYHDIVLFRWRAGSGGVKVERDALPLSLPGTTIERRLGKANGCVDDASSGIEPGVLYEYSVFVDYGPVNGRRGCSAGQSVTVTAVPAAKPVTNLRLHSTEAGIALSWETPAQLCDKVVVVRSPHHTPKDEHDGAAATIDRGNTHLDADVEGGALYHYSVFSVHQRHASACASESARYAPPPADFRAEDPTADPGHVRLTWSVRTSVKGLKLFRRRGSRPQIATAAVPTLIGGEEVALSSGATPGVRDEVEPGVVYHYALFARYEAAAWSPPAFTTAEAVTPTRPVTAVRPSVLPTGHVSLRWSSPDPSAASSFRYHVWRRERGPGGQSSSGERIGTTDQTAFVDQAAGPGDPPVPGMSYEYAVQAAIGPVHAVLSPWADVFVTCDVTLTSALGVRGAVVLEWTPPRNVRRVVVKRDGAGVIIPSGVDRAQDSGLSDGTAYSYIIIAVFADAQGREVSSPGVRATATPITPAEPVHDLRVGYDDGAVKVSWTLPAGHASDILMARLDTPPSLRPGSCVDASTVVVMTELPGDATHVEDRTAEIGRVYHYAVYAVNASTATFCGSLAAPLFAAVEDLTAKNAGDRMWLHWKWPEGVDLVRIKRVASMTNETITRTCAIGTYNSLGSLFEDSIPSRPDVYVYEIRVVGPPGIRTTDSLLSRSVTQRGGVLPKIMCTTKNKRHIFEMRCSLNGVGSGFGGLALIGSDTRDPLSMREGELVDHYLPGSLAPVREITLKDRRGTGKRYRYYQVFLLESDPLKSMAELVRPALSERMCD